MSDTGAGGYTASIEYIVDRNATVAEVVLDDGMDHTASATGSSKREPEDKFDPQLGVLMAVGRAFLNLGDELLETARAIIKERYPEPEPLPPYEIQDENGLTDGTGLSVDGGGLAKETLQSMLDYIQGAYSSPPAPSPDWGYAGPGYETSPEELASFVRHPSQQPENKPDALPRDGRGRFARRVSAHDRERH